MTDAPEFMFIFYLLVALVGMAYCLFPFAVIRRMDKMQRTLEEIRKLKEGPNWNDGPVDMDVRHFK